MATKTLEQWKQQYIDNALWCVNVSMILPALEAVTAMQALQAKKMVGATKSEVDFEDWEPVRLQLVNAAKNTSPQGAAMRTSWTRGRSRY